MSKNHVKVLKKDPVMAKLISAQGPLDPHTLTKDLHRDLIESIINQQLSLKAAATITKRFIDLFGKKDFPSPQEVLKMDKEKIRAAGISYSKISYIKNISMAVSKGDLDLKHLKGLPDEEVTNKLVEIKGVGPWTAEMVLMFSLAREDVFSVGDAGLRAAVSKHYKVKSDNHKKILKISENWKPYRTYAARYLWKSLES